MFLYLAVCKKTLIFAADISPIQEEANNEINDNMKRIINTLLLLACCCVMSAQGIKRPKLVVGIVVDQMRWDYLYYYYDQYKEGGLKRLLNDGYSCENTMINYVPTVTAIGHSCIYTG